MKISCIQMDIAFACPDENFIKAENMLKAAAKEHPDIIVLPELWNTGFFPKNNLAQLCDTNTKKTEDVIGGLAKKLSINIVAGSIADQRNGKIYNTAAVFDRAGNKIALYDKIHLFSPMDEHAYFENGNRICRFDTDGVKCGIEICYDIRFPELTRSMSVQGTDILFLPAQWPDIRVHHLDTLIKARAIENQMYVICCNSCGHSPDTNFAGNSAMIGPLGEVLVKAGIKEQIITADIDLSVLDKIRQSINVFNDRRPELYGKV